MNDGSGDVEDPTNVVLDFYIQVALSSRIHLDHGSLQIEHL